MESSDHIIVVTGTDFGVLAQDVKSVGAPFLCAEGYMFGVLLDIEGSTPWEILGSTNNNKLSVLGGTIQYGSLGLVVRRGGIALCFLAIAISVVKLLIYHDVKSQSELKENIKHKLYVIILISSLIALFTLMKSTFDSIFGM